MSEVKKIATREGYGKTLVELGAEMPNLVVLDADLAGATKTAMFKKAYPDRHFNCGIAEGNMMSIAAGLAAAGMVPFASSFAMFAAGRAFEQVRNSIGYPHLNVKIGATHGGISVGEDGASHQCLEDISLMRSIPGMVVMCPADDTEAKMAVRAAAKYDGPVYLRFGRAPVPVVFGDDYKFEIGKGSVIREGKDVSIIANGLCVASAIEAAEMLAKDIIVKSAAKTGKVVTAEEHSIIGGLGSAVAECLAEKCPTRMYRIGVRDRFGESASAAVLLHEYMLDGEGLYKQIKTFVEG